MSYHRDCNFPKMFWLSKANHGAQVNTSVARLPSIEAVELFGIDPANLLSRV